MASNSGRKERQEPAAQNPPAQKITIAGVVTRDNLMVKIKERNPIIARATIGERGG
jgi:hypothetical protein